MALRRLRINRIRPDGAVRAMSEKQMLPIAKAMLAALDRNDLAEFQRLREGVAVAKDAVNDPTVGTTFHFAPERVANVNAQETKDNSGVTAKYLGASTDPREPDHTRTGIFIYHNCSRCQNGAFPCVQGAPNRCPNPIARND